MNSTAYVPIQALAKGSSYNGGISVLFATPWQNIQIFPSVNPLTQELQTEPQLKAGAAWYGPFKTPNSQLGYTETVAFSDDGLIYTRSLKFAYPGNHRSVFPALHNMLKHRWVFAAKLRAGGFWVLIGSKTDWMQLTNEYQTGFSQTEGAGNILTASSKVKYPLHVLPQFNGDNSLPPFTQIIEVYAMEEISFNTNGDTEIIWTPTRKAKFGNFPSIEVWAKDASGNYYLANFSIEAVGDPPTSFIIRNGGGEGKIKIN